ncbi:hypothetical protein Q5P01_025821 [Channa striata]|uniref:Uncharacterized protein n=1 Tax=Channa striata TaxID=64152 RepID=A0AA88IN62_CHASR|nr:hypothetical protein Q5P01_025821 [Channa striata]
MNSDSPRSRRPSDGPVSAACDRPFPGGGWSSSGLIQHFVLGWRRCGRTRPRRRWICEDLPARLCGDYSSLSRGADERARLRTVRFEARMWH